MKQCVTKSVFVLILLSLSLTNCLWKQIGNGYTTKSKIQVYSKPDDTSSVLFEIPKNANFVILEKISKKDLKQSNDWWKIKKDNQVGYLKDQSRDSNLIFLSVLNPHFGLVAATSLFLRSEPNVESKAIEKLKTKDIVEILEESHSPISVNGKQGNWMKVKSKSQSIGYVFSPYIVIGDTEEILATLSDFETKESGWVYVKNKPSFVHQLYNRKLIKINNEQVEEDQFYFVKSRYVTNEGKVFFRVLKQKSRQEDWYSEIETTVITDCYLPAESLVLSNQYVSLYARIRLFEPTEKKIFDFLSKEISYDIDPNQTSIKSFQSKKDRYFIVTTTARDENDECIGCFLPELENIVYVLKEKANTYEIIFYESGRRSAIIDSYGISPKIIIRTSPLPEGDESPSKIYSNEYEFRGEKFVLIKSETKE